VQDVFNLLPNLGIEELARSFAVQSNDMMLAIYLASLTRSVLALHNLIDNKVRRFLRLKPIGRGDTSAELLPIWIPLADNALQKQLLDS
jgi:hypothetical protein